MEATSTDAYVAAFVGRCDVHAASRPALDRRARVHGLLASTDDPRRAVRATSGSGAFGTQANVVFVNTDPRWRGRGIGTAMTAAALRAAEDSGATRACLDASDAGLSIYLRLGFETVTRSTHYFTPRLTSGSAK